jgi:hypothetical protein
MEASIPENSDEMRTRKRVGNTNLYGKGVGFCKRAAFRQSREFRTATNWNDFWLVGVR